jgi:transposase
MPNAQSAHAHLLRSCLVLRENGFHRHVVSSTAVIEFFTREGNLVGVIYERLRGVYGDVCMGVSSVIRWVEHFKDGNADIADQPRCGQQRTAATESNKQKVDALIREDRRITEKLQRSLEWGTMRSRRWWRFWNMRKFVAVGFPVCLRVQRNTKWLGTALPSILESGFCPLRPPLVRALEGSPERSPLRDWRGSPGSLVLYLQSVGGGELESHFVFWTLPMFVNLYIC